MIERCRRICGGVSDCCITNSNQAACISDMVINKVSGIKLLIEDLTSAEVTQDELEEKLAIALKNINELTNWVKFLQIVHDLRLLGALTEEDDAADKRKETRYPLPAVYQNYIGLKIHVASSWMPASLVNFSQYGLQFTCEHPLELNESYDCRLSTERAFRKAVSFNARISNCRKQKNGYVVGATIEDVADAGTFNFFESTYNFILEISTDLQQGNRPLSGDKT